MSLAAVDAHFTLLELFGAVMSGMVAWGTVWPRLSAIVRRRKLQADGGTPTIDVYRENNQAYKEQNELRLAEIHELEHKLEVANALQVSQQRQIDAQQVQIVNLRELVLQVRSIEELTVAVKEANAASSAAHAETIELLRSLKGSAA